MLTRVGLRKQGGFTLIEMLIVVILLGILAMLIIPQISVSTQDARLNTLTTNLGSMRNSVELYYHQHNGVYPGARNNAGTAASATVGEAQTAFLEQLTQYTDINGDCNVSKTVTHIYGPYIKANNLPTNPFNDLNTVLCDIAEVDITDRTSTGATAWKFYTITGVLMANDGGHDAL